MLMKVLIALVTLAICFQRLSMAVGSIGWGISIAICLYFLWKMHKNCELDNLIKENDVYGKHIQLLKFVVLVMLWGILFTDNIGASAKEYAEMWWYRQFPFLISALVIREKRYLKFILTCFGITFCADCLVAVYQHIYISTAGWGFGGHHNNLGSITALLLPMLLVIAVDDNFSKKTKLFTAAIIICCIAGSLATTSRGSWITIACVCPLMVLPYVLQNKKKILALALVCAYFFGIFMVSPSLRERAFSTSNVENHYSNIGRLHIWNVCMYMVKDHPLGVGTGRYWDWYIRDYDVQYATPKDAQHFNHPHNNYIKIWVENGPVGILSYLYFCIALLWYNFKRWYQTRSPYALMTWGGWLAFLIYGWFDVIVDHSAITKIWWFVLGALLTLEIDHNTKGDDEGK
ncbi:MAG: O-antigen ligase family protein [Phascolarctobacterium sp.]|nr:O-antigen ligase family protein [Phascolarctobacterium sp.]